ncbi:MAG: erythromycin esterase family protein, partial [Ignavibacteriales bacterium]|nr:erythromycin esterase family protein [Ignavibacteriales bacterium]
MKRIMLLPIAFFSLVNFCYPQASESLLRSSSVIKSIDPNDEDYTDLLPLKKKIDEAQIVVLGEISHDNGATLQAKSRLVKFLHKEMGFDVLAWESGFIDCYYMNEALRSELPLKDVKKYMMSGGWDASEYVNPVFEYARKSWKTERPLIMAGFDLGRPPRAAKNYLGVIDSIFIKAPWLKPADSVYSRIDTCTKGVGGYLGNQFTKKFSKKGEQTVKFFIYSLMDSLTAGRKSSEVFSQVEKLRYSYFLRSFYFDIELNHLISQSDETYQIMRDKFMADRMLWLIEKFYPGKKIIVWAATAHFKRNTFLQTRLGGVQNIDDLSFFSKSAVFLQAGDYLDYYLGKKMYTIAFTTYQGERGMIFPEGHPKKKDYEYTDKINEPEPGSYESIAHETEKEYLFTDLRSLRKNNWLSKENIAYPFGYRKDKARWGDLVDAFF